MNAEDKMRPIKIKLDEICSIKSNLNKIIEVITTLTPCNKEMKLKLIFSFLFILNKEPIPEPIMKLHNTIDRI